MIYSTQNILNFEFLLNHLNKEHYDLLSAAKGPENHYIIQVNKIGKLSTYIPIRFFTIIIFKYLYFYLNPASSGPFFSHIF